MKDGKMTQKETRLLNEIMFEKLAGPQEPPSIWREILTLHWVRAWRYYKQRKAWLKSKKEQFDAINAVNDFTRKRMREDRDLDRQLLCQILPPIPISNDELDRQVEDV